MWTPSANPAVLRPDLAPFVEFDSQEAAQAYIDQWAERSRIEKLPFVEGQ